MTDPASAALVGLASVAAASQPAVLSSAPAPKREAALVDADDESPPLKRPRAGPASPAPSTAACNCPESKQLRAEVMELRETVGYLERKLACTEQALGSLQTQVAVLFASHSSVAVAASAPAAALAVPAASAAASSAAAASSSAAAADLEQLAGRKAAARKDRPLCVRCKKHFQTARMRICQTCQRYRTRTLEEFRRPNMEPTAAALDKLKECQRPYFDATTPCDTAKKSKTGICYRCHIEHLLRIVDKEDDRRILHFIRRPDHPQSAGARPVGLVRLSVFDVASVEPSRQATPVHIGDLPLSSVQELFITSREFDSSAITQACNLGHISAESKQL